MSRLASCPLCGSTPISVSGHPRRDILQVECGVCDRFLITDEALFALDCGFRRMGNTGIG